jgi:hypothetical protein
MRRTEPSDNFIYFFGDTLLRVREAKEIEKVEKRVRNMASEEEAKKKFRAMFADENGRYRYNAETRFVVAPSGVYGMQFDGTPEMFSQYPFDETIPIRTKMLDFKKRKTISFYNIKLLKQALELFQKMGYEDVAVKTVWENDYPIELIAISDSYGETGYIPVPHERIIIAPRIAEAACDKDSWREKESRKSVKKEKEKNESGKEGQSGQGSGDVHGSG